MTAVFDTNILIDFLNGVPRARATIAAYPMSAISVVTWMEVLVGARTQAEEEVARSFVEGFRLVGLDLPVRERAIAICRDTRMKLPDAIVLATARELGWTLITRDTRGFPRDDPTISIPYEL